MCLRNGIVLASPEEIHDGALKILPRVSRISKYPFALIYYPSHIERNI